MLHSIIIGNSSNPTLIILHGLFGESRNWQGCANILSDDFEVHLVDLRNHGDSFHSSEHNYGVMALDLEQYIHDHDLKNFSIIGHSMGGKVAMQYACLDNLNTLNKLIIVDIAPKDYIEDHSYIFNGIDKVLTSAKSRKNAFVLLNNFVKNEITSNFLLKSFSINSEGQTSFKFNIEAIKNNINKITSNINMYRSFSKEVYFLAGEYSSYINSIDYESMSSAFPSMRIINIPKAGHWVHYENKDYFLNIVQKCLLSPQLLDE